MHSFVMDLNHSDQRNNFFSQKVEYSWLQRFKEFMVLVENISKRKTKILISDNGGDFTSNEFSDFCKEARI